MSVPHLLQMALGWYRDGAVAEACGYRRLGGGFGSRGRGGRSRGYEDADLWVGRWLWGRRTVASGGPFRTVRFRGDRIPGSWALRELEVDGRWSVGSVCDWHDGNGPWNAVNSTCSDRASMDAT